MVKNGADRLAEVGITCLKNVVVTTFLTPSVRTGAVVRTAVRTAATTVFEMTCSKGQE
jgi:hypothetical protein